MPTDPTTTRPAGPHTARCGDCGFALIATAHTRECPHCGAALFPARRRPKADPDDPRRSNPQ